MSFLDIFPSRKINEALTASIQDNTARLEAVVLALNDRESPEKIREAVCLGLKDGGLEQALVSTSDQLNSLNTSLEKSGVRPIPVQTFPITDDLQFEEEKQQAAYKSARLFVEVGSRFIEKLNLAHEPVDRAMVKFFSLIDDHVKNPTSENDSIKQAMSDFLDCSPKRVIAAFQKHSDESFCSNLCAVEDGLG